MYTMYPYHYSEGHDHLSGKRYRLQSIAFIFLSDFIMYISSGNTFRLLFHDTSNSLRASKEQILEYEYFMIDFICKMN